MATTNRNIRPRICVHDGSDIGLAPLHPVVGFDEVIEVSEHDFPATGLKTSSLIRLGFLAVVPEAALLGKIGSLSPERQRRLLANLCRHLYPQDQTPAMR
jgi:hypothetical protein